MIEDPIIYRDNPDDRVLDLRPDGVSCLPVLGMSSFLSVRSRTTTSIPAAWSSASASRAILIFDSRGQEYPFMPRHRGLVGLRTPGMISAPGMKRKSFARRSLSPISTVPSAAVAIASN